MEPHGGFATWSPEQWVTVVSGVLLALSTFIVTIVNAMQNRGLKKQIQEHDDQCRGREAPVEASRPRRVRNEEEELARR